MYVMQQHHVSSQRSTASSKLKVMAEGRRGQRGNVAQEQADQLAAREALLQLVMVCKTHCSSSSNCGVTAGHCQRCRVVHSRDSH
jgi:hypothetical protein